jgi:WD40 repeat protein
LDVAYSPNGQRLAVGGADGLIRIVDAQNCKELQIIASHADWVNAVCWSADGKQLASASRDKSAKVYSSETGELSTSYAGHGASVRGIAFSADGLQILSVGDDKKLHRWSIEGAKKVAEVTFGGTAFKLASGLDYVLVPSADKLVHRVELQKNQETMKYEGLPDWALGTAVHQVSGHVVACSINGELRLWKAAEGTLIRNWIGMP